MPIARAVLLGHTDTGALRSAPLTSSSPPRPATATSTYLTSAPAATRTLYGLARGTGSTKGPGRVDGRP
jgi:hypothetical protein